jgi:predicted metal-dependent HD superfamily phosphohydrolase
MIQPNYEQAIAYALARLRADLPPHICYHDLSHTQDDVLPAVTWLAQMEGVAPDVLKLLQVAAAFHDTGMTVQLVGHEEVSVGIAAEALPQFGFSLAEIAQIGGMILATRLPQTPQTRLEALLADADLDVLGRLEDFWQCNAALRQELAAFGREVSDAEWYEQQIGFIRGHRYFTAAARQRRAAGKKQILAELEQRLREVTA